MWQTVASLTSTECTNLKDLLERRTSLVNLSKMLNNTALEAPYFVDVARTAVVAQVNKAQEQIGEWWSQTLRDHELPSDSRTVYRADLENQEINRFAGTGAVEQEVSVKGGENDDSV